MNIKDIKYLRKQFNLDRSMLRINDVYSVFINGDTREVLSTQHMPFQMFEEEVQQLLLKNMKKALSGNIDVKLFEKEFNDDFSKDAHYSANLLDSLLHMPKDGFIERCNTLIQKLRVAYTYDKSVAVYFTRATLHKKDNSFDFVICTVNKAETPKEQLVYNHDENIFEYKSHTEPVIKMTTPLDGFMYPVYENEYVNRDKVVYYSSKSNKVNASLITNVLNCHLKLTAKQEKNHFHDILNKLVGGKIKPVELYRIYDNILRRFEAEEDEEFRTLAPSVLEDVLIEVDLDPVEKVDEVYTSILGRNDYRFKVNNIIPDISKKSVNIGNDDTEINIRPDYLENVHQIQTDDGDIYLLIRLNENLSTNGFNIDLEPVEELLK